MDYSPYMEHTPSPQERRELQEQWERKYLAQLWQRWKLFPFPLQLLLAEHLKRYGCDAACEMTEIVERTITIYTTGEEAKISLDATGLTVTSEIPQ